MSFAGKRLKRYLIFISVFSLFIVILIVLYIILFVPGTRDYKEYILIVERGDSLSTIAYKLEKENIIKDRKIFILLGKLVGIDKKIVPSAYKLDSSMSVFEILDIILNQKIYTIKVRIPEGSTSYDIDRILYKVGLTKQGDILKFVKDQNLIKKYNINFDRLEGFLYPSTYYIPFYYKDKPKEIIEIFLKTFFKKIDRYEYTRLANKVGLTFEQAVILASIIEKEAGVPKEEKYLISSVFHNRLKKRIQLASCATVIYGLMDRGMWKKNNLQKWHLTYDTPYNTYLRMGLPKTPISNPSLESLKAAVMPYDTEYFYFVSKNDGTHVFSKTYQEHLRYTKIYQIDYWRNRRNGNNN